MLKEGIGGILDSEEYCGIERVFILGSRGYIGNLFFGDYDKGVKG